MPKGIDRIRRRVRVGVLASARGSKAAEEPADSMSTAASSVANIGGFDLRAGRVGRVPPSLPNASDAEIDELIREVDEDGNGEIDFGEFCHCLRRSQQMKLASNEEFIRQCFSESIFGELDVCSNGYLSADQFAAICDDYMLNDQSRVYAENRV
ncbi:EF hand [Aphelenchoides fujianensis]|nr:EF hand [Aphelenchoides fujianensis]